MNIDEKNIFKSLILKTDRSRKGNNFSKAIPHVSQKIPSSYGPHCGRLVMLDVATYVCRQVSQLHDISMDSGAASINDSS